MLYERINFINGQTLHAEHLNHLEDGITAMNNESLSRINVANLGIFGDGKTDVTNAV